MKTPDAIKKGLEACGAVIAPFAERKRRVMVVSKDLISRKALVKALIAERDKHPPEVEERYSFGVKLPHRYNQAIRGGIRKALREIEMAPSIDAVPVVHGRWVPNIREDTRAYPPYTYQNGFKCSVCGRVTRSKKEPYCHCGAKMDREANEVE